MGQKRRNRISLPSNASHTRSEEDGGYVTLNAPTVSAVLRRAGLLPTSSTREGIHVSSNGPDEVMVIADLPTAQLALDLYDVALKTMKDAGYQVRVPGNETATFYVAARR
jgi:hypothetical protein